MFCCSNFRFGLHIPSGSKFDFAVILSILQINSDCSFGESGDLLLIQFNIHVLNSQNICEGETSITVFSQTF
jgi:hypothetical protein